MTDSPSQSTEPAGASLGLWDAVSIIIGIVVGISIFKVPQLVFGNVAGPWQGMLLWVLGGVLSLLGSLCYAELATTYPRSGGDYVYLSRAYGRWVGFLFGWAQLAVILTGSIGAMAYVFADYGVPLLGLSPGSGVWLAVASVASLSVVNLLGVVFGKTTQNILTVAKLVGLAAIAVVGFYFGGDAPIQIENASAGAGVGLAMVFVLYAYGGWNDAAFVAAEVRNRRRNIPLALALGTIGITLIYLVVNGAYLWGLGFEGVRSSSAPAADVLGLMPGSWGSRAISVLVMISALGAINGLIFTGSRVFSTLGADHRLFAKLGRWHPKLGVPVWSILALTAVSLLLIVGVGTEGGRSAIDMGLAQVRLKPLPWKKYFGGFETLVAGTAPVFWSFFLLTGLSVFSLRELDRDIERPYRVPFYPFSPFVFCLMCVYMLYSSLTYAEWLSLLGFVPLAIGLPLYFVSRLITKPDETTSQHD